jgi:chemotaxis protein MotB
MRTLRTLPVVAFLVLAGCAGQTALIEEQRDALLELADENDRLASRVAVLQDSLQFIDDIDSGQYYRDRLALEDRINRLEYEIALCRDGSEISIEEVATFSADDLFAPASADLSDAGRRRLNDVASRLRNTGERVIRIEGHADSVPLGPSMRDRFPTNWELSAARAATVLRALGEMTGLGENRFELAAFGDTRPIASNQTAAGRAQNRRVVIGLL